MAQRLLRNVVGDLQRTTRECRRIVTDAEVWSQPGAAHRITPRRRHSMTELAFLKMYLAWETFLEESFVLYLMGSVAPAGRAPRRLIIPPTRAWLEELLKPETRKYADWDASAVRTRALRFFRNGRPFHDTLHAQSALLAEAKTLRNAIAHEGASAHEKFERLVRDKLGAVPPQTSVGSFLNLVRPGSVPPESFFDYYVDRIDLLASQIVKV